MQETEPGVATSLCLSVVDHLVDPISCSPPKVGDSEPGEPYELTVVHLETGRFLDVEELQYKPGENPQPLLGRRAALERKDELLDRLPYARVQVVNSTTGESEAFTSAKLGEYTREARRYRAGKPQGFWGRIWKYLCKDK